MTHYPENLEIFEEIQAKFADKYEAITNEAETRKVIIDRVIHEFLGWDEGMVKLERNADGQDRIDYILQWGVKKVIVEAKSWNIEFPSSHKRKIFKINGKFVQQSELSDAIDQCIKYSKAKGPIYSVVTNGIVWGVFQMDIAGNVDKIVILNPVFDARDITELHKILSLHSIESGGTSEYFYDVSGYSVLHDQLKDKDAKLERNNIAKFILPIISNALNSEFILSSEEMLKECYVSNDAKDKYDETLAVHLDDSIVRMNIDARRIRRDDVKLLIEDRQIADNELEYIPPVKLVIGSVGSGKTTYLKHFEMISGKATLASKRIKWINIDMGKIGDSNDVKGFIIGELFKYIQSESAVIADWKKNVLRAYSADRDFFRKSFAAVTKGKEKADEALSAKIEDDLKDPEKYVQRFMKIMNKDRLHVIVLDNIDLFENQDLEKRAFSEGVALSKRFMLHVIVSIRDTTYTAHKNTSTFDAYELEKLWIDPPQFRDVLSRRLDYSSKITKGKHAIIPMANGMNYEVKDLSQYFDLLRSSILADESLQFYEAFSDNNIRKGIELIKNFIISGHVQADTAIQSYILDGRFRYSIHEIFKASVLSQWKHYTENKAECINVFNSKLNDPKLSLSRLYILLYLFDAAKTSSTQFVKMEEIKRFFCRQSMSLENLKAILEAFRRQKLIKTSHSESIDDKSVVFITKCGAYYVGNLIYRFHYIEMCMTDSFIFDEEVFTRLLINYNDSMDRQMDTLKKMRYRKVRMGIYLDYLEKLEAELYIELPEKFRVIKKIKENVLGEVNQIVEKLKRRRLN